MKDADHWIKNLGLIEHPEGGHFKETYRAAEEVSRDSLPSRYQQARVFSTSTYYLLEGDDVSRFHRLKSDEVWHFYVGSSLSIHIIDGYGAYSRIGLGSDSDRGQVFQAVVPAGIWFGATVDDPESYSLVGCTVAPGFDFKDFELASGEELLSLCPAHRPIIDKLTRGHAGVKSDLA